MRRLSEYVEEQEWFWWLMMSVVVEMSVVIYMIGVEVQLKVKTDSSVCSVSTGGYGWPVDIHTSTHPTPQHYFHDTEQKYANVKTEFMNVAPAGTSCVCRPAHCITSLTPLLYRNV